MRKKGTQVWKRNERYTNKVITNEFLRNVPYQEPSSGYRCAHLKGQDKAGNSQ